MFSAVTVITPVGDEGGFSSVSDRLLPDRESEAVTRPAAAVTIAVSICSTVMPDSMSTSKEKPSANLTWKSSVPEAVARMPSPLLSTARGVVDSFPVRSASVATLVRTPVPPFRADSNVNEPPSSMTPPLPVNAPASSLLAWAPPVSSARSKPEI